MDDNVCCRVFNRLLLFNVIEHPPEGAAFSVVAFASFIPLCVVSATQSFEQRLIDENVEKFVARITHHTFFYFTQVDN